MDAAEAGFGFKKNSAADPQRKVTMRVRNRAERDDPGGKMITSMVVGEGPPGERSLRHSEHDFEGRLVLFAVESEECDETVSVQFLHTFDRSEVWVVLE